MIDDVLESVVQLQHLLVAGETSIKSAEFDQHDINFGPVPRMVQVEGNNNEMLKILQEDFGVHFQEVTLVVESNHLQLFPQNAFFHLPKDPDSLLQGLETEEVEGMSQLVGLQL